MTPTLPPLDDGTLGSRTRIETNERTSAITGSIEFDAILVAAGSLANSKLIVLLKEAFRHAKVLGAGGDRAAVLEVDITDRTARSASDLGPRLADHEFCWSGRLRSGTRTLGHQAASRLAEPDAPVNLDLTSNPRRPHRYHVDHQECESSPCLAAVAAPSASGGTTGRSTRAPCCREPGAGQCGDLIKRRGVWPGPG
jgi:hypothetical protein